MTKDEVLKYAEKITYSNTRTIITFKNGDVVVGFFDNNSDPIMKNANQWNFVVTPIVDEENRFSTFNGKDFSSISIITV